MIGEPFAYYDLKTQGFTAPDAVLPFGGVLAAVPVRWPRNGRWDLWAAYPLPGSERGDTMAYLPTPRASDCGTAGRRASPGFRPPLSAVVLPLFSD